MKKHIIDRIDKALFDPGAITLSEKENEILERIRAAFTVWVDNPMKTDSEIRDFLMNTFDISKTQAYRDLINTKLCLGNVKAAGKEWQRYRANSIIEEAYRAAVEGDHKMAKSLALIAGSLVRINRLDVDEGEQIMWDEVIPQTFEPSSDPTTIGLKPIPNLRDRIEKLKQKYIDDISIDIPYEDVNEPDKEDLFQ
jgi:hypothetical protein